MLGKMVRKTLTPVKYVKRFHVNPDTFDVCCTYEIEREFEVPTSIVEHVFAAKRKGSEVDPREVESNEIDPGFLQAIGRE